MKIHHLIKEDNERTIETAVGDILSVELDSNPTTGFDWAFDELDASMFAAVEDNFNLAENAAIGAGGAHIFKLKVIKAGRGQIKLKYRRSWEGDSSIRDRFTLTVEAA
jgi:inhibitor of cysteine peptidase